MSHPGWEWNWIQKNLIHRETEKKFKQISLILISGQISLLNSLLLSEYKNREMFFFLLPPHSMIAIRLHHVENGTRGGWNNENEKCGECLLIKLNQPTDSELVKRDSLTTRTQPKSTDFQHQRRIFSIFIFSRRWKRMWTFARLKFIHCYLFCAFDEGQKCECRKLEMNRNL